MSKLTKNILIRSLSRSSGTSSSMTFTLKTPINVSRRGGALLRLEYFQFYNTLFNVTASNNALDFNENSTNKSITPIAVGIYDASTLASTVASALTTASGGYNTYTVTYNSTTKLFTFSASNAFTLLFGTGGYASTSLFKQFGFTSSSGLVGADSVTGTSCTSPYIANLSLPLSMYIIINDSTTLLQTTDGNNPHFYIPANSGSGGLVQFTRGEFFEQVIRYNNTEMTYLQISLQFPNNASANLNGSEWEMILSVEDC